MAKESMLDGETITFSDDSSQSIPIPNPGSNGGVSFLGFTDAGKQILSITYNVQIGYIGDIVGLDDVRFVLTNTVPEPTSLALFGVGKLGLAGWRLRRKHP
jgi:hypothetical protein